MTARALLEAVADGIKQHIAWKAANVPRVPSLFELKNWESTVRTIASSLEGQADEHYRWRQEICDRLGLDCAAGITWTTDQVYEHVRELEIAATHAEKSKDKPA